MRGLVHQFSISFRFRPAYVNVAGERSESGCEVELIGQHYCIVQRVSGGCPHCLKALLVLLEFNDVALSEQEHLHSDGHVEAQYEKLIRYASTARDCPEVVLGVEVNLNTLTKFDCPALPRFCSVAPSVAFADENDD